MPDPGSFLDPSLWPLFMQSGMTQAPPQGRTAPSDLDMNDPFARAAYRQQQSVRPDFGRAGEGPSVRSVFDASPAGGALNLGLSTADIAPPVGQPANAASRLARVLGVGDAQAADESGFQWTDSNKDRAKEIADIQKRIDDRSAKIFTLGTTSNKSPAGAQAKTIESLKSMNSPDAPDVQRLNALRQEQTQERENALGAWHQARTDARKAAEEKKWQETSAFDVIPGTRAAIAGVSPYLSYRFGKFVGGKLPAWGALPTAATAGALSGFGSVAGPTEMDINSLPRSSPTRQGAEADLDTKNYWLRTALASGFSAAMGAKGAIKGNLELRPNMQFQGPAGSPPPMMPQTMGSPGMPTPPGGGTMPAMPPLMPPSPAAAPSLPPPVPIFDKRLAAGKGGWRDPSTGNIVSAPRRSPGSPPPMMGE